MFKFHSIQITPARQQFSFNAWIDLNDTLSIGVNPLDTGGQLALYKAVLTETITALAKEGNQPKVDIEIHFSTTIPVDRPDETALLSVGVLGIEFELENPEQEQLQLLLKSAVEGALQRIGYFFTGKRPAQLKLLFELESPISSLKNIEHGLGGALVSPLEFRFTHQHTVEFAKRIFFGNLRIRNEATSLMLLRAACSYLQISHKHFTFFEAK